MNDFRRRCSGVERGRAISKGAAMRFGVCAAVEQADLLKVAGWDFVEEHVQNFIEPLASDAQWRGPARLAGSPLPVLAANVLVPGALKIVGPAADLGTLRGYLAVVMARAAAAGIETLVFGSGAARTVPDGFPRDVARRQILDFLKVAVDLAAPRGIMLVAEHLNRRECNIINTVAEAMEYVRAIDHPHLQCLADSYHLWLEDEPLANVAAAMPWMRHVHVSEKSRKAPSQSDEGVERYLEFFRVLKAAGYDRTICVEALWDPALTAEGEAARVLGFVKEQWERA
jgi:sugar phosphate isomerase/epimerase